MSIYDILAGKTVYRENISIHAKNGHIAKLELNTRKKKNPPPPRVGFFQKLWGGGLKIMGWGMKNYGVGDEKL